MFYRRRSSTVRKLVIELLEMRQMLAGDLDLSFAVGGHALTDIAGDIDQAEAIAVQPDGKAVVAGNATVGGSAALAIVRYNVDGSLDTSFDGDGVRTDVFGDQMVEVADMALQDDGKIVVVGTAGSGDQSDYAIVRYDTDGSLDTTFGGGSPRRISFVPNISDQAKAVAISASGQILVAGQTRFGPSPLAPLGFSVLALTPSGQIDQRFGDGGRNGFIIRDGTKSLNLSDLAFDGSGNVIAVGTLLSANGMDAAVVRFTAAGFVDTSFGQGGLFEVDFGSDTDRGEAVVIDSPSSIYVVGHMQDGTDRDIAIAKLNVVLNDYDISFSGDGRLRHNFAGGDDQAVAAALDSEGFLLVAGTISLPGPQPVLGITRVSDRGVVDLGFGISSGWGRTSPTPTPTSGDGVTSMALDNSGQILVAGKWQDDFVTARFTPSVTGGDADSDGVPDLVENGVPYGGVSGGDGNNDGTPDRLQRDVTSVQLPGGQYVTLALHDALPEAGAPIYPNSTIGFRNVRPVDIAIGPGVGVVEFGPLEFSVAGPQLGFAARVELIMPPGSDPGHTFFSYGASLEMPFIGWHELGFDGTYGAIADVPPPATTRRAVGNTQVPPTMDTTRPNVMLSIGDGGVGDGDLAPDSDILLRGTPLVDFLTGSQRTVVTGVFGDRDQNGQRSIGEVGLVGRTVFLDENRNGELDPGEESTVTDEDGDVFLGEQLDQRLHAIAQIAQPGWRQTRPFFDRGAAVSSPITAEQAHVQDIDADGDRDFFMFVREREVVPYFNRAAGEFEEQPAVSDFTRLITGDAHAIGQFDATPQADLAVLNRDTDRVQIYSGSGSIPYQPQPLNFQTQVHFQASRLFAADLTGDGLDELITLDSGTITVHVAVPSGLFGSVDTFVTGGGVREIVAADVNSDSRLDLVVSHWNAAPAVLLNRGGGSLSTPIPLPTGIGESIVAGQFNTASFNGDSFLDLAITMPDDQTVVVVYGDGTGSFSNPTVIADREATAVAALDFDKDGDDDIVFADRNGRLVLMEQFVATPAFTPQFRTVHEIRLDTNNFVRSLTVVEVNNDANPDLLAVLDRRVEVLYGNPHQHRYGHASPGSAPARFGNIPIVNGTVSGVVYNDIDRNRRRNIIDGSTEPPVEDVVVYVDLNEDGRHQSMSEPFAFTGPQGEYELEGLATGTRQLRVIPPFRDGWRQTDPAFDGARTVEVIADQTTDNQDFGITQTSLISGVVFADANRNGVRDATEAVLPGRVVYLDADDDLFQDIGEQTARTDDAGNYIFDNLSAGNTYRVRLATAADEALTVPAISDELAHTIDLVGGVEAGGDFGVIEAGSISGRKWSDANGNRQFDPGESGIAAATVFVDTNYNGVRELGEPFGITDGDGLYRIDRVPPGDHVVTSEEVRILRPDDPLARRYGASLMPLLGHIWVGDPGAARPRLYHFGDTDLQVTVSGVGAVHRVNPFTGDSVILENPELDQVLDVFVDPLLNPVIEGLDHFGLSMGTSAPLDTGTVANPITVYVGAPDRHVGGADIGAVGGVFAFDIQGQRLSDKDIPPDEFEFRLGLSFASANERLFIGGGLDAGRVLNLDALATTAEERVSEFGIFSPLPETLGAFGDQIETIGEFRLISEPGADRAHLFTRFDTFVHTFESPQPGTSFGVSLTHLAEVALIGAPTHDAMGAFHLYNVDANSDEFGAMLESVNSPAGEPGDLFGLSAASVGASFVVGAPGANRAYQFDAGGQLIRPFHNPLSDGSQLGFAVAPFGDEYVVIGDPSARDGAALMFEIGQKVTVAAGEVTSDVLFAKKQAGTVAGHVTEMTFDGTTRPAANALVSLGSVQTTADSNGNYLIENVPVGKHRLRIATNETVFLNSIVMNHPENMVRNYSRALDLDGVPPAVENAAPNLGDGDNDGTLDSIQEHVTSLPNAVTGTYVTVASPPSTVLTEVRAVSNPHPATAPAGVSFPFGFVTFGVGGVELGGRTEVELIVHEGPVPNTYYKYGPTPDDPNPHWYEFLYDPVACLAGTDCTGAEINGNTITLHFEDGGRGDSDLLSNQRILDPGAPGVIDRPTLQISGPSAGVRSQPIELLFDVNPPGHYTYDIDWDGDGTADETLAGPEMLMVPRVFPDAGEFVIQVTAQGNNGISSAPAVHQMSVEIAAVIGGDLLVGGTPGDDWVLFDNPGHGVHVKVNHERMGPFAITADARLIAFGGRGDDRIRVSHRLDRDAVLFGGPGDDRLRGGRGDDLLVGDSGHDDMDGWRGNDLLDGGDDGDSLSGTFGHNILIGGAGGDRLNGGVGRNFLIGGIGGDRLVGHLGQDIMVGGTTSYDDNHAALRDILAEWSRPAPYAERLATLRDTSRSAYLKTGETVLDDMSVDWLLAGFEEDWLFYDPRKDKILDKEL